MISNSNQLKPPDHHYSNQFDTNNLLDPSTAHKLRTKDSNPSIFTQQSTNLLKPPQCTNSNLSSKQQTSTPNLSSQSNLKTDLTPSNLKRRCIGKNGVANIKNAKISRKNQRFFLDFFNTMIDIEWHYNLLAFTLSFVISWLFFGCIWYSIGK